MATAAAQRIHTQLQAPVDLGGRTVTVCASVGVHVATAGESTSDSLVRAADEHMYASKQRAHGRVGGRTVVLGEQSLRDYL